MDTEWAESLIFCYLAFCVPVTMLLCLFPKSQWKHIYLSLIKIFILTGNIEGYRSKDFYSANVPQG